MIDTDTQQRRRSRRRRLTAVATVAALASTSCVIPLPDGAIPGGTDCTLTWLEPALDLPPAQDPGAGFIVDLVGLVVFFTPLTRCANT